MSRESKIGVFVLIGLAMMAYFVYRTSDLKKFFSANSAKTRQVSIYLDDASGMREGTSLEIAGVKVGKIAKIKLDGEQAVAIADLNDDMIFREGAGVEIRTKGVLGERYVALHLGKGEPLASQDQITGKAPPDLGQITDNLNKLALNMVAITESIKQSTLTDSGGNRIAQISGNIEQLTEVLIKMIDENRSGMLQTSTEMAMLVHNLNQQVPVLIGELTKFSTSLGNMAQGNRAQLDQIVDNLEEVTGNFKGASASLNSIGSKLDDGDGTIGKLINEPDTANKLNEVLDTAKESMGEIKKLLGKANSLDLDLIARSEYFSEFQTTKNYFGIRIAPTKDKYYLFEGVSLGDELVIPEVRVETTETYDADGVLVSTAVRNIPVTNKDFLITGQLAYRLGPIFVRGGFIESEGGGGVDYFSLDDRLKLSLEAFDFSRKDLSTHGRLDLRFNFTDNLYMNAGYDDFLEKDRAGAVIGAGIRWKDDDLKLLFSTLGKFK